MSSLTYTYKWQAQPYVPWKGAATNSSVPTYSRPLQKNETQQNGPSFSARPIKHWRKQLNPQPNSGRGRPGVGMPMDVPGGSVYLGSDSSNCVFCGPEAGSNSTGLKNNILRDNGQRAATYMMGHPGSLLLSDTSSALNCIACNPENNVIKSAITLLNKKYYSNTSSYLQSRCIQYDQKMSINDMSGINYFGPNGEVLWPENSKNSGPQIRASMNCPMNCTPCETAPSSSCVTSNIYKPSNRQYATQGAVSSGSRISRLKYNTITNNGNSFRTAWGEQEANAGRYHGTSTSQYFIKSKNQACIPNIRNRRPGNHTFCFQTPTGSIAGTGRRGRGLNRTASQSAQHTPPVMPAPFWAVGAGSNPGDWIITDEVDGYRYNKLKDGIVTTFNITRAGEIEYILIGSGGGGGGGQNTGAPNWPSYGGGGGGGSITHGSVTLEVGSYSATAGTKGATSVGAGDGGDGEESELAISLTPTTVSASGGSGGSGCVSCAPPGAPGGDSSSFVGGTGFYRQGGGGGAGSAANGLNAASSGTRGGDGGVGTAVPSNWLAYFSSVSFLGNGGGGGGRGNPGGGSGGGGSPGKGGGSAGISDENGYNGYNASLDNEGNGGGGGAAYSNGFIKTGGRGAGGTVIIRYLIDI